MRSIFRLRQGVCLTLALLATAALTARASADPVISVFGAAGSFGGLTGATQTPTGQSLGVRNVPGWAFLPGESAYFTAVGADGTVFMANEPQTDNQLLPTADQMAVSSFSPRTNAFRNIVIPTSTGATSAVGPWPSSTTSVGGADISDILATDVDQSPRIAFLSAMPYEGWNIADLGVYPTLGYLDDGEAGWQYDPADSVSALQIARSQTSATGTTCLSEATGNGQPFADCRLPSEMSELAGSQDLILAQYASDAPGGTSGGLTVMTKAGQVLATYAYPQITLPDGTVVDVHPREVDADPASPAEDEHFVVVFDVQVAGHDAPFAMQEFRFDPTAAQIVPLSAPVLTGESTTNGDPLGFETAQYDSAGDLWAAQSDNGTLTGGPLVVYRPQADGSTLARGGCRVPVNWMGTGWGTSCPPNTEISEASSLGIARSLNLDPSTGAMLLSTMSGDLLPVQVSDGGATLVPLPVVDLGINQLADRTTEAIDFRKGSVDPVSHTLYLPVQQLRTSSSCPNYPCDPATLDQWLLAVHLDAILGPGDPPASASSNGSRASTSSSNLSQSTGTGPTSSSGMSPQTESTHPATSGTTTSETPTLASNAGTRTGSAEAGSGAAGGRSPHRTRGPITGVRVLRGGSVLAVQVHCASACTLTGQATLSDAVGSPRRVFASVRVSAGGSRTVCLQLGQTTRGARATRHGHRSRQVRTVRVVLTVSTRHGALPDGTRTVRWS